MKGKPPLPASDFLSLRCASFLCFSILAPSCATFRQNAAKFLAIGAKQEAGMKNQNSAILPRQVSGQSKTKRDFL